jgi:hypothetical protein
MAGVTVPARGRLMTMGGGVWGWEGPKGGAGGEAGGGRVETRELPSEGAEGALSSVRAMTRCEIRLTRPIKSAEMAWRQAKLCRNRSDGWEYGNC